MSKSVLWTKTDIKGLSLTKEERAAVLAASSKGFALFREILKARLEAVQTARASAAGYDSPAWPYKQADFNANERELKVLVGLLDEVAWKA